MMKKFSLMLCLSLFCFITGFSQGHETFDNFDEPATSYVDGNFEGQDGSTWEYTQSRGDYEINGSALMLGRNRTPDAELISGTLNGGIGTLEFSYMQAFSNNVEMEVYVNEDLVYTATSDSELDVVKSSGEIDINVDGDFTLRFFNPNGAQVVIDDVIWTAFEDDGGNGEVSPECEAIAIEGDSVSDIAMVCRDENLLNSTNMTVCGVATTNYLGGTEAVYTYTPSQDGIATVSYNGQTWSAIFVYQGCPTEGGECVDSMSSSTASKDLSFPAISGNTYYIIFDTWPSPASPCPGTFSILLQDACEGTPDAGTVSIDVTEGEPGSSGEISGSGYTEMAGITYALNYSVNEGEWMDLETTTPESTSVTFEGSPGDVFKVRMAVTCEISEETSYSEPVTYTLIAPDAYCIPVYTSTIDYISGVSTTGATQDISYSASSQPIGGYSDETASMLITESGSVFTLNTSYVGGANGIKIWIDWNNDNYFGEEEVLAYEADANASKTFTILVPEDMEDGTYRMRVRGVYGSTANPNSCGSTSYGSAIDFSMTLGTLDACTGADAGTAAETEIAICAGDEFSLSVSDASEPADGLIRNWQSSPAGQDDWTDIELATSTTLNVTDGVTENTDFRYFVTCGDESDASEIITITLNPANECYCIPEIQYGCDNDELTNFSLTHDSGTVNYDDGCTGQTYYDFTDTILNMTPGESYTGSANSVSSWTEAASIWIDLNQDGLFSEDERLAVVPGINNGPVSFTLDIPEDAMPGQTRMRVGQNFSSAPSDACGWSYGMALDYTIEIEGDEPPEYCIPEGVHEDRYIENFSTTGGQDNINNLNSGYSEGGYGDFTSMTVSQTKLGEVNFTVDISATGSTQGFRIWVDWNQDGEFDTENEVAYQSTGYATSHEGSFTVPATALPGPTRMRIVGHYLSPSGAVDPCITGFTYGEFEDYTFNVIPLDDCEGTPDGGSVVESEIFICPVTTFTIAVTDTPDYAEGMEMIWQSAPAGSDDWTDIEDSSFVDEYVVEGGVEEATNYRFRVTCLNSGESGYSEVIEVTINTNFEECYCIPTTTGDSAHIIDFSATGDGTVNINNEGSGPGETGSGYSDFTEQVVEVHAAGEITYSAVLQPGQTAGFKIWVDWNNDGIFDEDGEELLYASSSYNNSYQGSFSIPETASGTYRMRIGSSYTPSTGPATSCGNNSQGEYEDYTIEVLELDNCEEAVAGTPVEDEIIICPLAPFTLEVNGASDPANGLTRMWQSSPAGQDDWTDLGVTTPVFTVAEGVSADIDYRYSVSCEGGSSDISEVINVIVNTNTSECYCIPEGTNSARLIDDFITTGAVNNVSNTGSGFSAGGYGDFTDMIITQAAGEEVSFSASLQGGTQGFRIWVDWNQDGIFDADTEVAYQSSGYAESHSGSFTVPADALSGNTRMRIVGHWLSTTGDVDPCETGFTYGEFEDYTFEVLGDVAEPCAEPEDIFIDDITSESATVMWEPGDDPTGMQFELIYGPAGFDVASEGESVITEDPIVFLENLDADTEYDVYVRTLCANEDQSDWVGPESFTTEEEEVVEPEECPAPTDLNVELNPEDTESSVIVTWTAGGSETMWAVIYGEEGFTEDDDFNTELVFDTTFTITGLEYETIYDVYVVAVCDAATMNVSDQTGPVTFSMEQLSVSDVDFVDFAYYPNPVNNQLNLQANSPIENVEVYNLLGQLVSKIQPMSNEVQLDSQGWQSGVYLMKVTLNGVEKTLRVIRK